MRRQAIRSIPGRRLPAGPPPRRPDGASPTWQGTVSKFPPASPRGRHPGSSPAGGNLGPAPRLLRPAGEPKRDYPTQRLRLRLRDLIATRNHLQITIANAQGCRSLTAVAPAPSDPLGIACALATLCPPYSPHPTSSSPLRPVPFPDSPTPPAKARKDTQSQK